LIHDAQHFDGEEDLMVLGYRAHNLSNGYYVTDDFQIANTGTPLLSDDSDASRVMIAAYNYTDYVALPVFTATGSIAYKGEWTDSDVPMLQQIPTGIQFNIPGTTPPMNKNNLPISPHLISASVGQLGPQHYLALESSPAISGVQVDGDDVTIIGDPDYLVGFFARSPQYVTMLSKTAMNVFFDCSFGELHTNYSFTSDVPVGQRAPSYYQLRYNSDDFTFSKTLCNLIEWRNNSGNPSTFDITLHSYDTRGNEIRKLSPFEFVCSFLFRD